MKQKARLINLVEFEASNSGVLINLVEFEDQPLRTSHQSGGV